jgi:seryl-tRNA synthetase
MPDMDTVTFRDKLFAAGVLIPTGIDGVYGRSGAFEDIVTALGSMVTRLSADREWTRVRFPPLLARAAFERTDYLRSFPNLIGSVHTFLGDDRMHAQLLALVESGTDWSPALDPAEVVLSSAACHSLYPTLTGTLPASVVRYDLSGFCFRHEPSIDPARMQSFRMHELVVLGDTETTHTHREEWVQRGLDAMAALQLKAEAVVANDPFFGRAGRILAAGQREEALKIEIVAAASTDELTTAVISCNEHKDHFGVAFDIALPDGGVAQSACVGFGLERLTLALLRAHGFDPADWPVGVRDTLWP